ncbi:polyprenol phosphomannose-dependent alpha 1,6 mannosyltransferase MptB [Monashia sp. NPDC004114]
MGEVAASEPAPVRGSHRGLWRWAGCAAAVALAASSWGSGARPELNIGILWPGIEPWRATGGSPLLATVSVLAMGLLVVAWWRLRWAPVSLRWWWTTIALWFVPLVASVPLYSRDLYSYAAQGALWADGLNPYEHAVRELDSDWRASTAPTWLDTPTPYGPFWLLLARGVATVSGGHLWLALLLLRLLAVVGVVVIAWAVADIARRLGASTGKATWLGVACPLVGAHFVSGAHNDALMVAAVLAAVALALRRRFVVACLVIALGAMVKVTAVIALPFIALMWARGLQPRRVGASSEGVVAWGQVVRAGLFSVLVAGVPMVAVSVLTGLGFGWVNPASTPGKNEQWTSIPTSLGIAVQAIGHLLGQGDWRDPAVSAARAAGLVVLALLLVLVWLGAAKALDRVGLADEAAAREDRARVVRGIGWAMLAAVVLAPVFLPWYYLWVLPVLAVSLEPRLGRGAATALAAVASVICFMTLPEGYSLALRTTGVGVPVAIVATVLLVRVGARTGRRLDWRHLPDLSRPLLARRST